MAVSDFDSTKFAAEIASNFIGQWIANGVDFVKDKGKKCEILLQTAFKNYLKASLKKYSLIKTILYKDQPKPLVDLYVDMDVKIKNSTIKTNKLSELLKIGPRLIITGTAGVGKSTLMKRLFLRALDERYIPIFVELRSADHNEDLIDSIYKQMANLGFNLEKCYLIETLKLGKIVCFFDGYDEVDLANKEKFAKRINELSDQYKDCYFIISSRPDPEFAAWNQFTVLTTLPLSKEQACELINRLEYEKEIKHKFLKELSGHLFKKHESFLSNPLLLTIMLMSYDQYAEIPSKIHLFYSQAFETLFSKHDATKLGYKRKMYSNLAYDDFKRILSCFSILSYFDSVHSFNEEAINKYLNNSMKILDIKFNTKDFTDDLLRSVCILSQDGLNYVYIHRSFQEYFSAVFILNSISDIQDKLIQKLMNNKMLSYDIVLVLMFSMNKDIVDQKVVLPFLEQLKLTTKYNLIPQEESLFLFYQNLTKELGVGEKILAYTNINNGIFSMTNFIQHMYINEKRIVHKAFSSGTKEFLTKYNNQSPGIIREEKESTGENILYFETSNTKILKNFITSVGDFKDFLPLMECLEEIKKSAQKKEESLLNILMAKRNDILGA
jgi:hypothetical protein